jgi:hypothetical protein
LGLDDDVRGFVIFDYDSTDKTEQRSLTPPLLGIFTNDTEQDIAEFLLESIHRIAALVAPLVLDVGSSALVALAQRPQSQDLSPHVGCAKDDASLRANTVFRGVQFMSYLRSSLQYYVFYAQKHSVGDKGLVALTRGALRCMDSDVFVGPIVHLLQTVPVSFDWFAAVFATLEFVKVLVFD